jgi:hypothetical protein
MSLTYDAVNKAWTYIPEAVNLPTNLTVPAPLTPLQVAQGITLPPILDTTQNNLNAATNALHAANNTFYSSILNIATATKQGSYNYLSARQAIQNLAAALSNSYTTYNGIVPTSGLDPVKDPALMVDTFVGPTGYFRNFYLTEQVTPWDPSVLPANLSSTLKSRTDLGANFDKYLNGTSGFYSATPQGQAASAAWDKAVADDNLDIISRYATKNSWLLQDYINQITDPTKTPDQIAAIRGSESAPLSPLVTSYQEQVFPDVVAQQTRDQVQNQILGLQAATAPATGYKFPDIAQSLSNLVVSDPTINQLWTQAKAEVTLAGVGGATTGPWMSLINSLGVDKTMLTDQASFGSLLGRVALLNATNTADKTIIDANSQLVNTISNLKTNTTFNDLVGYAPAINDAFTASVQDSERQQITKFGQLRQDILQNTIDQLILAKRQEANLSFFKTSSVGQEITALQQDISNSLLGDIGIGGISPLGGAQKNLQNQLTFGLDNIFGSKNGLLYNWEDWFNNQIEKKYAGNIDIPNDYIPPALRTKQNGFIDDATAASWKQYDDAYATLQANPNDLWAKAVVSTVPPDYVPVSQRKTVQASWNDYETQLKAAGYVDPKIVTTWAQYDQAYADLQKDPTNTTAQAIYDTRPADYIPPSQRMDKDVQFAKDFFSQYLKPRFDASQSISEFQNYIDVTNSTQNPFQTQDKLNALKLAAETSVSNWFTALQKAGPSSFNSDYYFDPVNYLTTNGVGDPTNPLLPGAAFTTYGNTAAGIDATNQSAKVNADWAAAKAGQTTTDDYGNVINWAQEAYRYGIDVNNKAAFAQLHYQVVGMNAPEKDASGNIVKNPDGTNAIKPYDPAPDVYGPQVAKTYITQILTPFLIDQSNKIGAVFGQFIKPSDYVDQILQAVNLPQNKDQWNTILQNYGIDPNASLSEIKNTLVDALSQDSTLEIKQKINDAVKQGKTLTQTELGVEYIQRAATASGTTPAASGLYAIFQNAGFNGTESQFYSTFLPDASAQDINLLNATYTTSGKTTSLIPTITGTGMQQIASMASLFGDTGIQEILGTAGVSIPSGQTGLIGGLFSTSGEDIGIGDPFADTSTPFATVSGATQTSNQDQIGIGNPFDVVGITDPFADNSDPFASSNPFSSIGSTSSVSKPTINTNPNVFTQGFSSSKNSSFGSLFDSFGGSFGF